MIPLVAGLAETWWSWMMPMAIQVMILGAVVWMIDRLLGAGLWPQQRATLWWILPLKLILPPFLASPVSIARLVPEPGVTAGAAAGAGSGAGLWVMAAFLAWATGALVLGSWAAVRYLRARNRILLGRQTALPVRLGPLVREASRHLGLKRPPRVEVSTALRSPAVVGLLAPRVVLPAGLVDSSSRERLNHLLMHELAHIKRRDPAAGLLAAILQVAYWFHPVSWLAAARLATLREEACDRAVARHLEGPGRREYRRTLIHVAEEMIGETAPGGLAFVRPRHQVLSRLAKLEAFSESRAMMRRTGTATAAALLLACCVPLGAAAPAPDPGAEFAELAPKGCLIQRYQVLAMLAKQRSQAGDPGSNQSTTGEERE